MRNFWVQYEYVDLEEDCFKIQTTFIVSDSVEGAIREAFGFTPRPASPLKYDVCSQEEGEAGYRYWFR
jgi:hypothetical protein